MTTAEITSYKDRLADTKPTLAALREALDALQAVRRQMTGLVPDVLTSADFEHLNELEHLLHGKYCRLNESLHLYPVTFADLIETWTALGDAVAE